MKKLAVLQAALDTCRDDAVRQALHRVLPSFHTPEEINRNAEAAEEMRAARQSGTNA